MTQEEKDLLLKDLCARLPYGVKCIYFDGLGNECEDILNAIFPNDERILVGKCSIDYSDSEILGVVPYLFPRSSMNREQNSEYLKTCLYGNLSFPTLKSYDWLNEHNFDYRGLIEKGLAIDATNLNIY